MSFNPNANNGTAEPLRVEEFLQFLPSFGAGVGVALISPLGNIISGATKQAVESISKLTNPAAVVPKKGLSLPKISLTDIFKGVKTPTISGNKAILGTGLTVGGIGILSLTEGGQNLVNTSGSAISDISKVGSNITELFSKNPLIPIGLLALGTLIVIGVMKK